MGVYKMDSKGLDTCRAERWRILLDGLHRRYYVITRPILVVCV
jgi:hypothetical protein